MEKALIGFIVSFLTLFYCVAFRKWNGLYVALPGMFISAMAMAYTFFGGV